MWEQLRFLGHVQLEEKTALVSSHQKALEQMRAERNAFSRDSTATQAEIAEAKRKLEIMVTNFGCEIQDLCL